MKAATWRMWVCGLVMLLLAFWDRFAGWGALWLLVAGIDFGIAMAESADPLAAWVRRKLRQEDM